MAEMRKAEVRADWGFWMKHLAASVIVASLVAWIDWGGVDRTSSDRILAASFAFMSVNAFSFARLVRRFRMHPSHVAAEYCGAVSCALLTVAMLTDGLVAMGFWLPGLVCMGAHLSNLRTYRRAIHDGTAFPQAAGTTQPSR